MTMVVSLSFALGRFGSVGSVGSVVVVKEEGGREGGRWTMVVTFVVGAEAVCVLLRCEVDVGSASREVHRPPIHRYVWRERERESKIQRKQKQLHVSRQRTDRVYSQRSPIAIYEQNVHPQSVRELRTKPMQ